MGEVFNSFVAKTNTTLESLGFNTSLERTAQEAKRLVQERLQDKERQMELFGPMLSWWDTRRAILRPVLVGAGFPLDKPGTITRKVLDEACAREVNSQRLRAIVNRSTGPTKRKRGLNIIERLKTRKAVPPVEQLRVAVLRLRKQNARGDARAALEVVASAAGALGSIALTAVAAQILGPIGVVVAVVLLVIAALIALVVVPILKSGIRKAVEAVSEAFAQVAGTNWEEAVDAELGRWMPQLRQAPPMWRRKFPGPAAAGSDNRPPARPAAGGSLWLLALGGLILASTGSKKRQG